KKLGKRSIVVRKGDNVKVVRGKFKGKTGKVSGVNLKRLRLTIESLQRQKKDGTKINVYFNPSKIQILELVEDKLRMGKIKTEKKEIKSPVKENKEIKQHHEK
ncbi:MAG: 50S ribosomal protein L24, partial [Candidatus Pacearchaeota archaeon]|nr:50S ribosomal protein L24 [Candidatus Pacearchaeota archaeon]